jgi:hypothetical protein
MSGKTDERKRNKRIRVRPSTHTALKRARRGDMTLDDVIRDALRDYEPYNFDPAAALEDA